MRSTAKADFPEILSFGDQSYGDELLRGAFVTLQISFSAYGPGLAIGLAGATGKLAGICSFDGSWNSTPLL
jgi:ABC-type arginine transport system permease subunit